MPRWRERFWAALFLQPGASPVPARCRFFNVPLAHLHPPRERGEGRDLSWERSFHCCCLGKTLFPGIGVAPGGG